MFKCLYCGETKYELIKNKTRDSDHKVVQCKKCELQQLYPLPTIKEDKNYYDKNLHDKSVTPDFGIDDLFQKFCYQNKHRIDYLINDVKMQKNWKILDYASGYGFFIEMMEQQGGGYDISGIEISKERLRICKDRIKNFDKIHNINLLEEGIYVPDQLKEKFDLVTMFHLIEHIASPVLFLKKVSVLLKEGGYLLLEMPNVSNIMMDLSEEFNDFFYIRDHVTYYTPELIKKVVEDAGYEVVKQYGAQMYGLMNHMNWIFNGTPQYTAPSYEAPHELTWLEKIYKQTLEEKIESEYMYLLARKK